MAGEQVNPIKYNIACRSEPDIGPGTTEALSSETQHWTDNGQGRLQSKLSAINSNTLDPINP
jgi:hypothetical protein